MQKWMVRAVWTLVCWGTLAGTSWAEPWKCSRCGCCQCPRQVCKLVPDVERVVDYQYFMRCESFCVPGKSCCVGCVPKECRDPSLPCQYEKIWQPSCGPLFTRGKLCKRPVVCERPVMRCVVETVCCSCGCADPALAATGTWSHDPRMFAAGSAPAPTCAAQPPVVDQSMFGGGPPWLDKLLHGETRAVPVSIATQPTTTR